MLRFWLRRPNPKQKRHTFSILCVDGEKVTAIEHPTLDRINADRAKLAPDELEGRLQALLRELRDAQPKEYHPDNLQVVERYWQAHKHDRQRVSDAAAKEELVRAAQGAGLVLLVSGTRDELQTAYNAYPATKQRRLVTHANRLLKFLNRGFLLSKKPEEPHRVSYITLKELRKQLPNIANERLRLAVAVAFATGARLGELVAMRQSGKFVLILDQVRRNGKRGSTKNKNERAAFVIPELRAYVKAWCELSQKERLCVHTNHRRLWVLMKEIWGIRPHDLRHSYAIHLAGCNFGLAEIASQLGDTEKTARKHYLPFLKSDREREFIARLYKKM